MKLTCNREQFLAAFQTAAAVAPSRNIKPILQNVKLEVTKDSAIIMATDLEIGIRVNVSGVEVERAGVVLLPVANVGTFLRESSSETVSLECDEKSALLRSGTSKFRIPTQPLNDFPAVPTFNESKSRSIPARLLREMFRRTAFATGDHERFIMNGVFLDIKGESATAVGCDSHRMSTMKGSVTAGEDSSAIVPVKAVRLIERSLAVTEGDAELSFRDNDVLVRMTGVEIYSRLLSGRFPKYQDAFPSKGTVATIELAVGPFASCVRQAAIASNEMSRGVDFKFGRNVATLSATAANVGDSHAEMPIAYDGEDTTIRLDPRFVSEFLKVLDPEKVFSLEVRGAKLPAVFHTDDGFKYVTAPLNQED